MLTKKDITKTGAPATLLVFNNEVGFSRENIDSICSIGRSTKKGKRRQGFIGEKGNILTENISFGNVSCLSTNFCYSLKQRTL